MNNVALQHKGVAYTVEPIRQMWGKWLCYLWLGEALPPEENLKYIVTRLILPTEVLVSSSVAELIEEIRNHIDYDLHVHLNSDFNNDFENSRNIVFPWNAWYALNLLDGIITPEKFLEVRGKLGYQSLINHLVHPQYRDSQ
jgi:hypothetical protein